MIESRKIRKSVANGESCLHWTVQSWSLYSRKSTAGSSSLQVTNLAAYTLFDLEDKKMIMIIKGHYNITIM